MGSIENPLYTRYNLDFYTHDVIDVLKKNHPQVRWWHLGLTLQTHRAFLSEGLIFLRGRDFDTIILHRSERIDGSTPNFGGLCMTTLDIS